MQIICGLTTIMNKRVRGEDESSNDSDAEEQVKDVPKRQHLMNDFQNHFLQLDDIGLLNRTRASILQDKDSAKDREKVEKEGKWFEESFKTVESDCLFYLPENQIRYKSEEEMKRIFTSSESKVFTKGTLLYHGNENDDEFFEDQRCCLFFSTDKDAARSYGRLSYWILEKDVTVYKWAWPEIAIKWGFDVEFTNNKAGEELTSWNDFCDFMKEPSDAFEVREAEFEANQAMADLELDGRFDDMDDEIMLTPFAYDALRRLTKKEAKALENKD